MGLEDARNLQGRFAAGAAAGNITVTGIKKGDKIVVVAVTDGTIGNIASEFTATANDTINNTGGTSTATKTIFVQWITRSTRA